MKQYLDMMQRVMEEGVHKQDRTGTGTISVFGHQMRFDLAKGFPLVTTKKCHLKSIIHELIWFLSGDTNIQYLKENDVKIWDAWADEDGNLGPVYGSQWRSWPDLKQDSEVIDQIANVIEQIKTNPDSRRLIVSAWNPAQVDDMALPPCHALFQFYTQELTYIQRMALLSKKDLCFSADVKDKETWIAICDAHSIPVRKLSCQLYQRSADIFLGVPFNIASYALLTMMIAQVCNLELGEFVWTGGDCHLYTNHLDQAIEQMKRMPYQSPLMVLNPKIKDIDDFTYDDFTLMMYHSHPHISAPIAV